VDQQDVNAPLPSWAKSRSGHTAGMTDFGWQYQAYCTCGWHGPGSGRDYEAALGDRDAHLACLP
jgi:hypothetical protein